MRQNSKPKQPELHLSLSKAMTITSATVIATSNGFLIDGTLPIGDNRFVIMVEKPDKVAAEIEFLKQTRTILNNNTRK